MKPTSVRDVRLFTAAVAVVAAVVLMILDVQASWACVVRTLGCHLPVLLGAWALAGRVARRTDRWLLAADIYFAGLIGLGLLLGEFGLLTPPIALCSAVLLGGSMLWAGRTALPISDRRPQVKTNLAARLAGAALLVLILLVAWRSISAPSYDYDVLTYHLMFPARWIQDHAIFIVPTWCGDPAPAYSPLAAEVYYTWLFLPAGGDVLARCGQFAFWLLLLLAVQALAGELRLGLAARRCVAIVVAIIPAISAQAATAMVDVAFAAHLVAVAFFCLRIVRRQRRSRTARPAPKTGDVVGLALSGGLLLGTKYMALAYLAAFLPLLLWAKWRCLSSIKPLLRRPAVLLAMATAWWIGGFWYVRNGALTGNPVYPLHVQIGSVILFDGVYGRAQMENSPFNIRRLHPVDAFGRTVWQAWHAPGTPLPPPDRAGRVWAFHRWYLGPLGLLGGLFMLAAVSLLRTRGPRAATRWATLLLYLCSTVSLLVFWWVLPFQQSRFAWGPIVLGLVAAAGTIRNHRRAGPILLALALIVCWRHFGAEWSAWLSAPWGIWAAAVVCAFVLFFQPRLATATVLVPIGSAVILGAVLTAAAISPDPRAATFSLSRWRYLGPAWAWIDRELHGVTIAYVGNNVPFFLCGRRLENRVLYVAARTPAQGRFDEYAATPEARRLGPPNTAEPAPDRYVMDTHVWLDNLRQLGVDYVMVTQMFPNLLLNLRHDRQGFPIERQWLDAMCERPKPGPSACAERRVFAHGAVRLYRLRLTGGNHRNLKKSKSQKVEVSKSQKCKLCLPPVHIVRNETDALDRLWQDRPPPGRPIRDYPLARAMIQRYDLRVIASKKGSQ